MAGFRIEGNTSGNVAEVNASNQLKIVPETNAGANPGNVGALRVFSENDAGTVTGTPYLASPETDDDFRLRVAAETLLDTETFNYTAQNTGKHGYLNTTMTNAWTLGNLTTNSGNITTTTTGTSFRTYAFFPIVGVQSLFIEMEASFSAQPTTNATIDFGAFLAAATTPYAPTDGVFFRLTSAGLSGVANYNGAETSTGVFTFAYTNNHKYQFIVAITEREVEFWIDGVLYGQIETPTGLGQPCAAAALPFQVRHANVGAAGAPISFQLSDYTVSVGGAEFSRTIGEFGNASLGSYQGQSGGTMGSLATYANSTNPTAQVPTNTTAALGTGLGGQVWETDTLAVTTDGIILSYQVPAGTVSIPGRRLKLRGVTIDSYVQTGLTGGGYVAQWSLAFGHTSVSLATAEAANAKAPRRVPLGVQSVASGALALVLCGRVEQTFDAPIYINPGEFVAVVKKKIGTAPSAGVIGHVISYDYSWE